MPLDLVDFAPTPADGQLFIRPDDGRYYWIAAPAPDLFGDLVVECWYGSLHSRRGQYRCHAVPDRAAAEKLIGEIGQLRRRHGYQEVRSGRPEGLR